MDEITKYHQFSARATLYPGKSDEEVLQILNLKPDYPIGFVEFPPDEKSRYENQNKKFTGFEDVDGNKIFDGDEIEWTYYTGVIEYKDEGGGIKQISTMPFEKVVERKQRVIVGHIINGYFSGYNLNCPETISSRYIGDKYKPYFKKVV